MRTSTKIRILTLSAVGLTTACYGGKDDMTMADTEGGDGDGDGDGGADGDGDGGTPDGVQERCEESKIGPPMLRRLTRYELGETIRAVFPEISADFAGTTLGPDTVSALGFANDAAVLTVTEQTAKELEETAQQVATLVTTSPAFAQILPCAATGDAACASSFVDDYGARLFRRALTDAERQRYLDLQVSVQSRSDFATGIRWTLVAMLQSPHVVYRSELGEVDDDGRGLQDWELASALSYDFAGGPPDAELLQLAAEGALADPDVRVQQARRLLGTAAGKEVLARFYVDWLDYERVDLQSRPNTPEFDAVRESMSLETRRYIDSVLASGGGVDELLLSDHTVLDPALAGFYGYGQSAADGEAVTRPESWSVGLLAQGSILAANSHAEASSPTRRGLLVYERLLCNERPPVPENIPPIEPPSPGATTTRQRYEEQHAGSPACSGCHALFDPIGFAFEHFDETGRYRADESGLPIDASGALLADPDAAFDGLTGLSETLAELPEVTDCISGLSAAYVFGGAGGTACVAEDARAALAAGDVGLAEFVAQIAASPHFSRRTGG